MNRVTNGNLAMPPSVVDKSKDWQLEILMEKLRSKASQYKSLTEISKNVRMAMLDKRYALDSVEKSQHQKCLDTLQHSIKVTSLQSMIERLESLTRQLGLKFMVGPSGVELFISSDMFYLEIVLDQTGAVKDVKVHHDSKLEQQSCAELVNCLSSGDFADFTAQLEGFASIYQLNAEKKVKCKAFTALQSLESDLSTLAHLQSFMKEPFNLLYKSPVGVLEKRRGGHPMKLTYFVSPYDLLNVEKCDIEPITVDTIVSKALGYSVTVCMEGSATHKLQTTTLITVNRNINGKSTPSFSSLSSQNSAAIPACFVLKLNKPMPMCVNLVRQIQQVTELDTIEQSATHPLLSLIVHHASEGKMESGNNKGLFVTLPDQTHCYFMTENKNMDGVLVSSIPFTHPAHVSQILVILRQQALFNTIIGSCVRPNSKQDFENMTMFEISALSWTHISLSLEHPIEESMATAEIDLSDISNLVCKIVSPGTPPPPNAPDTASDLSTKILNRCFSIPVTMRAVLKLWEKQTTKRHYNGHENFSLPLGSGDPGGHKGAPGGNLTEFGGLDKIKQEPLGNGSHGMMMQSHQGMFLNESMIASANFPNFQTSENMLTSMELTNILAGANQSDKMKRPHKRKSDDLWKNKRKLGEGADPDLLVETSSSDSTSRSTPISQENEIATPNSGLGFQSDLELMSGLDPADLLAESDKVGGDFGALDELGDVEEMLAGPSRRKSHDQKSPTIMMDLGEKSLVPPSVSITPIASTSPGFNQGGNAEKRPGIEIIALATSAATALPSSITITPITTSQSKGDEKNREKKRSKSSSDDKGRLEKKRKRKRDESPMGPPDKVPPKQDPLTKPVTVSIKPAESPPLNMSTPTSPSMMRKFNASPTQNRNISMSGKLSPNLMKPTLKTGSSHHSPKHSPAHVPSSPKHIIPGISSPKSHGTSPKHPSTSGSGKPSMSTLKSAANSPKNSDSKTKSTSKDSSRDKEKKISGVFNVASKNKSSVKVKPLDLNTENLSGVQDGLPSPSSTDLSKSATSNQVRNRKGSLSAIVDKLKSAQHCDGVTDLSSKGASSGGNKDRSGQVSTKLNEGKSGKIGETKNSEYMVKPSSDGMKITINKTRSKESKTSVSKSGSGSPKTHTGLKPGVNSGPASKKPQHLGQKLVNSTSGPNYSSLKSKAPSGAKLSSGPSKLTKLSNSPKSATDLSRKDRPKLNKSSSEKSIFTSKDGRKSSPTSNRDESDGIYKMSKMDHYNPPSIVEGLMTVRQLDKNFQIPKLSARASVDDKKPKVSSDNLNNINRTVDTKIFDMMNKSDLKYPLALPQKTFDNAVDVKLRNNVTPLPSSSPKLKDEDDKKDQPQNLAQTKDDSAYKVNYPIAVSKSVLPPISEPLNLYTKSIDLTSKFVAPAPKDDKKDVKKNDDVLLDFSAAGKIDKGAAVVTFPQSPSVSVHIVKSPAPSPLIAPSPHSASPCITDDELMDEAVIGIGK
ncbi:mediator of RNA polymerase II transcription subunit 1 [Tribolium castaneum]|uniref:Mediator of RNA polymerase II transcription subunit 1 n=1 Tax=Tribolium castaneum TaxID=7070 RepID=D6WVF3_TRICA|nr:PREDICTED: mediator of RNA polymerase II transcription subunit 1 [Tribolium castaneum]EFA08558.1 hypothetical protein TcasGA2_TC006213 [Tribolium castaneum]|eukprot:XP_008196473.1 PREDICTED: mediator of RNA polymerase II transcription subunit 1 [Tribolium castaneum]